MVGAVAPLTAARGSIVREIAVGAARDAAAANILANAADQGDVLAAAFAEEAQELLGCAGVRRARAARLRAASAEAATLGLDVLSAIGADAALLEDREADRVEGTVIQAVRETHSPGVFGYVSPEEKRLLSRQSKLERMTSGQLEQSFNSMLTRMYDSAANYGADEDEAEEIDDGTVEKIGVAADVFGGDLPAVFGDGAYGAFWDLFKPSKDRLLRRLEKKRGKLAKVEAKLEELEDAGKGGLRVKWLRGRVKRLEKSITRIKGKLANMGVSAAKVARSQVEADKVERAETQKVRESVDPDGSMAEAMGFDSSDDELADEDLLAAIDVFGMTEWRKRQIKRRIDKWRDKRMHARSPRKRRRLTRKIHRHRRWLARGKIKRGGGRRRAWRRAGKPMAKVRMKPRHIRYLQERRIRAAARRAPPRVEYQQPLYAQPTAMFPQAAPAAAPPPPMPYSYPSYDEMQSTVAMPQPSPPEPTDYEAQDIAEGSDMEEGDYGYNVEDDPVFAAELDALEDEYGLDGDDDDLLYGLDDDDDDLDMIGEDDDDLIGDLDLDDEDEDEMGRRGRGRRRRRRRQKKRGHPRAKRRLKRAERQMEKKGELNPKMAKVMAKRAERLEQRIAEGKVKDPEKAQERLDKLKSMVPEGAEEAPPEGSENWYGDDDWYGDDEDLIYGDDEDLLGNIDDLDEDDLLYGDDEDLLGDIDDPDSDLDLFGDEDDEDDEDDELGGIIRRAERQMRRRGGLRPRLARRLARKKARLERRLQSGRVRNPERAQRRLDRIDAILSQAEGGGEEEGSQNVLPAYPDLSNSDEDAGRQVFVGFFHRRCAKHGGANIDTDSDGFGGFWDNIKSWWANLTTTGKEKAQAMAQQRREVSAARREGRKPLDPHVEEWKKGLRLSKKRRRQAGRKAARAARGLAPRKERGPRRAIKQAQARVIQDDGGWSYQQNPDGSVKILVAPPGSTAQGMTYRPGSSVEQSVRAKFGPHPSQASVGAAWVGPRGGVHHTWVGPRGVAHHTRLGPRGRLLHLRGPGALRPRPWARRRAWRRSATWAMPYYGDDAYGAGLFSTLIASGMSNRDKASVLASELDAAIKKFGPESVITHALKSRLDDVTEDARHLGPDSASVMDEDEDLDLDEIEAGIKGSFHRYG